MKKQSAFATAEALFLSSVDEHHFLSDFQKGVAVALSGGADSVLLLILLSRLSEKQKFPLKAIHIHHGIRGAYADRDKDFCEALANRLGVCFSAVYVDAIGYAKENKLGLEEAARILRYRAFSEFLIENREVFCIATAHHAGDNLETMLFHLARGTGLRGLAGIPPRRDRYVRPMLSLGKKEILDALSEIGETFVYDATNKDETFRRNYIRENIVPRLSEISARPDMVAARVAKALRIDEDYLSSVADEFLMQNRRSGRIPRKAFSTLHTAVAARVVRQMIEDFRLIPEQNHIETVISLARFGDNDFRVDIRNGFSVYGDASYLSIAKREETETEDVLPIKDEGITVTADEKFLLFFASSEPAPEKFIHFEKNVYRLLKQIFLSRDTINKGLYLRRRKSGDAYRYGGMTHKLKTLFNSMKLTREERDSMRLLCDEKGILYVPGFSVRDGEDARDGSILFYTIDGEADTKQRTEHPGDAERHGEQ